MCGELFRLVVRKKIFKQSIARKSLPKENYFGRWILRPAHEDWTLLAFPKLSHETNTVARVPTSYPPVKLSSFYHYSSLFIMDSSWVQSPPCDVSMRQQYSPPEWGVPRAHRDIQGWRLSLYSSRSIKAASVIELAKILISNATLGLVLLRSFFCSPQIAYVYWS